jgi:protein tyrosine phosphatase (PTP) superfamily phosphohydrolase (DUF442 family)
MFGITIAKKPNNYKRIDELVSRSAMPNTEKNMKWLKKQGVTDIVNFRISGSMKNGRREREVAEKYGIRYHHIPTDVKHPSERQVGEFLDIVEGVENSGGKLHLHCRWGADRTGMYSWIYKQKHGLGEMAENEKEMHCLGHDCVELPSLINWVKDYLYKDWGGRKCL